jgi:hypothetical protein
MLIYIINLFHLAVIFFVLTGPFIFSCSPIVLLLHAVLCFSLLIHWYYNNDVCCLSEFEAYISGKERVDTFSHSFIAPLYNISEKSWTELSYILTSLLMIFSIYKLVTCEKTKKIIENIKNGLFITEDNIKLLL